MGPGRRACSTPSHAMAHARKDINHRSILPKYALLLGYHEPWNEPRRVCRRAVWFGLSGQNMDLCPRELARLSLGRRHVADRFEQGAGVEPVNPFHGGELVCRKEPLRSAQMDHLGREQPVDCLGQCIVEADVVAADRGLDARVRQRLCVAQGEILSWPRCTRVSCSDAALEARGASGTMCWPAALNPAWTPLSGSYATTPCGRVCSDGAGCRRT